jgi:hypothetical protein
MSGHVFIVRGDLRRFACDAWLISTDRRAAPRHEWFLPGYAGPRQGEPFVEPGPRVQPLPGAEPNRPRPWLGWIGRSNRPVSWYTEGAREFLDAAARTIAQSGAPPLFGRARALLALPVVGTGRGGAAEQAGAILQSLLPVLYRFVTRARKEYGRGFDVALVCFDAASHAAAQAQRAAVEKADPSVWPDELTAELRGQAEALARYARHDQLALFLGAGVSAPAGLPRWPELIGRLAVHAGMSAAERQELARVGSALDQATIVERWLEEKKGHEKIGAAVKAVLCGHDHYALTHALLAALPVREVITTNYDQLFDTAWQLSDPDGISVLPDGLQRNGRRWLLKMHGCLSKPERVVLTRSSYIRYDQGLPALAGLVQGLLLTRHILFVGFSMTDDNFHRLVDGVRRLRGEHHEGAPLGTALWLGKDALGEMLWNKDIRRVRMDDRPEVPGTFPFADAARRLEIFLDYLVSRTRDASHLLVGPHFDPLLTDGERALRDALQNLAHLERGPAAAEVRETVAWPRIKRLLRGLGFDAPPDE